MDRRIGYKIVIDTETCPMDKELQGVFPWNMLVYDCGWAVVDKRGKVYKTQSYINADVFLEEKTLMQSAYYANKIPQYWQDIKAGKRALATFRKIHTEFLSDLYEYNVKEVYAHNMYFDCITLNTTQRWLTKSKWRYFFPYEVKICDTLKMARDVIGKMPTYKKFCDEYGYYTSRGQKRFTAEILYRFISGNNDFKESHTGLEDVLIEKEILCYCYRQHKKMNKILF